MPALRLSRAVIARLPAKERAYVVYDSSLTGFGVRVAPGGTKSWVAEYRPGGGRRSHTKRVTLGSISKLSLEQARVAARSLLASAILGQDPAAARAAQRAALTVSELAQRFMDDEVKPTRKPRTADLYAMYFRVHVLPSLGSKKAQDVSPADVARLHRSIGREAPVTANRVLTLLSGLYSWAGKGGEVSRDFNPTADVTPFREAARERFLSAEEMARLGDTLRLAETVGLPWCVDEDGKNAKHVPKKNRRTVISPIVTAAIRLLLFTGLRLREVLQLRWRNVDVPNGRLLLVDAKTGRRHVLLGAPALAVLTALPRLGEAVFPGINQDTPRHDLHRPWRAITEHAKLEGVRLHDLRHSFASIGASSGVGLTVVGKLLGHRQMMSTARYSHFGDDTLRRASDQIGGVIADALAGKC